MTDPSQPTASNAPSTAVGQPAEASLIYGEVPSTTLISRGFNLVKYTLKPCLLYMATPIIVHMATATFAAFQYNQAQNPDTVKAIGVAGQLALLFSTYAMQTVAWTLMMFFIAGLCRMFYAGLFLGTPVSPKVGFAYIGKTWWKLLILFLGQMVAYIGFIVADVALIFVGGLVVFVLLMALMWLVTSVFNEAGLAVFGSGLRGLLAIGVMLVTFVIMMALITFQVMLLTFPLVAVAVSDGVGFFSQAFYGIQLAFANMRKVMLYSLSSLFVFMCISMALHLPVWLWLVVELGLAAMDNVKTAPDHVLAAYTLWGSLVFGFLVPAWMAGVTLLYYDCQACKEGLDLRRLFERMRVRRKIAV